MFKFLFAVVIIMITSIVCLACCRVIDEFIDRKIEKEYLPQEYYNYFYKGDYVVLWTAYKKSDIRERKVRRKGDNVIEEIVMNDRKRGKRESIEVNECWEKEYNRWNKRWGKVIKGKEDKQMGGD